VLEQLLHQDVPLAPRTSLRVGGPARWFMSASSAAEIAAAHAVSRSHGLPMVVLGGGTNVVVADEGIEALVVAMQPRGFAIEDEGGELLVTAAAGEPWDTVVEAAVARGGSGLECLSGIPGLTGGTPIQNVGAYGQDVAGVIDTVNAFDTLAGKTVRLAAPECGFSYRTSRFKAADAGRFVVCEVTFRLRKGPPTTAYAEVAASLAGRGVAHPSVADVRAAVIDIRRRKAMVVDDTDPDTRSVGSFFTNPIVATADAERVAASAGAPPPVFAQPDGRVKIPAAWLIERAGFAKGVREGAVGLSSRHTLAIVTREGATAADVVRFAGRVARQVEDAFGVRLRPEPVFLGFAGGEAQPDVDYLLGTS
jgi:UDP-N-acetylmuramate dehydrogenase